MEDDETSVETARKLRLTGMNIVPFERTKEKSNSVLAAEILNRINEKNTYIRNMGGKSAVLTRTFSTTFDKEVIEFVNTDTFKENWSNYFVTLPDKKSLIPAGKFWVESTERQECDVVGFSPNKPTGMYEDKGYRIYNLWEGFGKEAIKGDWRLNKAHIFKVLCNGERKLFKYVYKWFCWAVQNPSKQAEVALIFKGKKGAGKGIILQAMKELFGNHGFVISTREHLTGKHNSHLSNICFLFADEAYYPGDKEVEGVIKSLITEPTLTVEPKFRNAMTVKNCLHIVMATNADWVIPATQDERRYFITEINNEYAMEAGKTEKERKEYFNAIKEEQRNGGLEAMLYEMQNYNLHGWHPRNSVPRTIEMRKQVEMTLTGPKNAVMALLEDGIFPGDYDAKGYVITSKNMKGYATSLDEKNKHIANRSMAMFLKEIGVEMGRTSSDRIYIFPELNIIRKRWDAQVMRMDWNLNEKWQLRKMEF